MQPLKRLNVLLYLVSIASCLSRGSYKTVKKGERQTRAKRMWGGWYPSLNGGDASVLTVLWTVNQDTIIWDVPAMLILPDLCHMFDA